MEPLNLALIASTAAIGLAAFGFWLWMLVDCLRHESRDGNERLVWLVVLVATKLLGAALYYFLRRARRLRPAAG